MGDLAACTAALRCANGRKAGNRTLSRPEADDACPTRRGGAKRTARLPRL